MNIGQLIAVKNFTKGDLKDSGDDKIYIKSASGDELDRFPHDIRKECQILSRLFHPNIIAMLGSEVKPGEFKLYLPRLSQSLAALLNSSFFSPHLSPVTTEEDDKLYGGCESIQDDIFLEKCGSLIRQISLGVEYLHSDEVRIAHRDLNPSNIMIDAKGVVKLIDFGIAWDKQTDSPSKFSEAVQDLYELEGNLCLDIGTGPYKAPELLFGDVSYDPFQVDLWSLGVTISSFFTPLVCGDQNITSDDGSAEGESEEALGPKPFYVFQKGGKWERQTLFSREMGDLGLAGSIFSVLGSPTSDSWPGFKLLPDSDKFPFFERQPQPLQPLLPNLPHSSTKLVVLISSLVKLAPSDRCSASEAVKMLSE